MKKISKNYFRSRLFFVGIFLFFAPGVVFSMDIMAHQPDTDGDGLQDIDEQKIYYTDPLSPDTDGDGYPDGLEIANKYSPRHGNETRLAGIDSDKDYLNDFWELTIGTDIMNPDTDGDLYLDGTEVKAGYNPLSRNPIKLEKFIKVSIEEQKLAYYFDNKLLEEFLISGGLAHTPTPIGEFTVLDKVSTKHYGGYNFDYPNTKWNLHFTTARWRYYIHGAYWHDNFGEPMSHGCVNVSYDNMERLYWFSQIGTQIQIS